MADYRTLAQVILPDTETLSGDLGYTVRGVFRVVDPDDAKRFFVRFANGNWVSALHRGTVLQKPGLPVLVGYDNIGRPYIIGTDPTRIDNFLSSSNSGIAVGIHDHVRNSALAYITDTWLLKQLRTKVSSGMTVEVVAGSYFAHKALHWYSGGTINLTAYVPPTTGQQRWVIVGINPETGTLVAAAETPTGGTYMRDPATIDNVPFAELGYIPLAAVWINAGMTGLQNHQIEDLRFGSGTMVTFLDDLFDVDAADPVYGDVLGYDGYGWVPTPTGTSSLFFNQDLTSQIDGVENTFTIIYRFVPNTTSVYQNGTRLRLGVDYTEGTPHTKVSLVYVPLVGDDLTVDGVRI